MKTRQANPWAALFALCIGFFMILLDTTIVSVAIPAMLRGLDASLNAVVWVTSVYLLTYAVPMLFTSRLGDRFGPKRLFLFGLLVFTGASLWCGLAGTVEMLIAARAVQGLGAAIMTPQTLAFITHLFPPAKRGAPMGVWGGVAGLATITGPLLGGVLVEHFGWEWIFFVNVPIGVVALLMTLILVPDWQPKNSHSFDIPGILLSCAGLLLLVFGLQNGKQYDWGEVRWGITIPEIIGAGGLLLVIFLVWQQFNKREPLLPLRVFRHRNFSTGNIAAFAIGFAMIGMFLPVVIYIQSVLGFSPIEAGLVTAPMSLLSGVVAPFIGRLSDRISGKWIVMFGLVVLAGGLGLISLQAQPDMSAWKLVPALLVCGLGVGCIFSPLSNVTMSAVEPSLAGTASGVFNTARQVGGVVGSAAVGVLLQATVSTFMHDAAADRADALPQAFRAEFVDGMSNAGGASEFGGGAQAAPDLPPGTPDAVGEKIGRLATEVFHEGFTDAARWTLLLPAAVLLLGAIACMFMRRTAHAAVPAAVPAEPVAVPEQVAVAEPAEDVAGPERLVHGTISVDGAGLADVAVTLLDGGGQQVGRTATHTDGRFAIEAAGPGDYLLIASAPAHTPLAEPLSVNGRPVRVDLSLASTVAVRGMVRTDAGSAMRGTSISLLDDAGRVVASGLADDDGAYTLSGVGAGGYTLVAAAPGRSAVAHAVRVTDGTAAVQDVVLAEVVRLHGVARGAHGRPVPEAMITVVDADGRVTATALTDPNGGYTIDGLAEGDYTVITSGYPPVAGNVRLADGESTHDVLLEHQPTTP